MHHSRLPVMEIKKAYDIEHMRSTHGIQHELWPLDDVDAKKAKFPCCLVWTPLPVVSWLAPSIGHVGICREDGCCFTPNLGGHTCKHGYKHAEFGTAITWDDALQSSTRYIEHKTYNLFTCNSHSFVANFLNRICYGGSMHWNMINVAALVLLKGHWVDAMSVLKSFLPFPGALSRYLHGWVAIRGGAFLLLLSSCCGLYLALIVLRLLRVLVLPSSFFLIFF
ncbi:hypothetical protein RchiOBHm_Chr6g0290781 [Rosa chinensis]|uniref:Uncharacterized protein n=1 Tax=Rosa chinensis TaxID=74649 RepID=A0A2P6PW03_ROSCH|nr:hypothetical protein RchiOBHm_Chr6g0290781 [Rosa chinensis]